MDALRALAKVHRWLAVLPNPDCSYIFLSEASYATPNDSELVINKIKSISDCQDYVIPGSQPLASPLWLGRKVLIWSVTCAGTTQLWCIDMEEDSPRSVISVYHYLVSY